MEDIERYASGINSFLARYRDVGDIWKHPDGLGIIQDCLSIFGLRLTLTLEPAGGENDNE